MVATIIVTGLILIYSIVVIVFIIKEKIKRRKNGITAGCGSCAAYKNGQCRNHNECSSKNE